ncbi:MAG: hypothetical protein MUE81_19950 [Thermoflexibacter sp.]|nr:hypothetical protein [Thermoflexibacter sp.]
MQRNTLVTISDNKVGVDNSGDNTADFYQATVLSATDYYAFGMSMKERSWQSESYRYGFNGKENDTDWEVQDYGFRIYKPEIAKFLSVDPLSASYPWYTPYQFAGNKPIWAVDLDGLEEATSQQIVAANKYYQTTKLEQSKVFVNISPNLINQQIKQRLNSLGKPIQQGGFFLCGPAAACHIVASHDPLAFVKTIFDLYVNGFSSNNLIKGNNAIYEAKPDKSGNIDGIPAIDWILMHSLRFSENIFGGYNPHEKEDFSKMTFVGEFPNLLERLGGRITINASGSVENKDNNWVTGLQNWLKDGCRAVLFVDSRQYTGGSYENDFTKFISQHYGRHFIVLKGLKRLNNGSIQVSYWDKGANNIKTKIFKSIEDFKKASMDYWLVEQDVNINEDLDNKDEKSDNK